MVSGLGFDPHSRQQSSLFLHSAEALARFRLPRAQKLGEYAG
jgi:hypothetical protein